MLYVTITTLNLYFSLYLMPYMIFDASTFETNKILKQHIKW